MGTLRKLGQMLGLIKKDKPVTKSTPISIKANPVHEFIETKPGKTYKRKTSGAFGQDIKQPRYANGVIKFAGARKRRCAG